MADYSQGQGQIQGVSVRQEQTLAPYQLQSLNILAAPVMELRTIISKELSENPVLEAQEPGISELPETPSAGQETDSEDFSDELGRILESAAAGNDAANAALPSDYSGDEDAEEKREFLFQSIPDRISMQENLMTQLRLAGTDPETESICEAIIGSIDERGYLVTHPADIAMGENCSLEDVEKALKIVQAFEPSGIGARSLQECLLLQLDPHDPNYDDLKTLIENHLEDIAANRLPKIAEAMDLPAEALNQLIAKIRALNPAPGGALSSRDPVYREPEVEIVPDDEDGFKVIGAERDLPHLHISQHYLDMLENPATSQEVKTYIKGKLASAGELIRSIENRDTTIRRITAVIASEQYEFLKDGTKLRPMTLKHVADKLGLHETTVSRAVKDKYVATPQGVFEFKDLFTTGFLAESGEEVSSRSIQEQIRELIEDEDPAKPLSDAKLTEILNKQGLDIKRRTVAKYREELGIRASHLRKAFS